MIDEEVIDFVADYLNKVVNQEEEIGVFVDKEAYPNAILPSRAFETDAGFDVYSAQVGYILPKNRLLVHTGIHLKLPVGWECQVRARSGLSLKKGISVLNGPGTIDSSYVGEVGVILYNSGEEPFLFKEQERIAQLVFKKVPKIIIKEISEKPTNEIRGEGGFGSTGTK